MLFQGVRSQSARRPKNVNCRAARRAIRKIGMSLLACATLFHLFALVSTVSAQSIDTAHSAYTKGHFLAAADLAEALGTSEGHALAAKSLTIHAYYIAKEQEKDVLFERATLLAQRAVQTDPKNPEAHMQLSHVMGRHAQNMGIIEAATAGYGEKIRDAINDALRISPDMPEAYLSLGMWHAEMVSTLGSFMGGILYSASEEDALSNFELAMRRAPDEKLVPFEYALGLLNMDDHDYREKARRLLVRAIEMPGKDAYDAIIHQRAIGWLARIDASKP